MALPNNIRDREHDKFKECGGNTAVRTWICQDTGETIDVSVDGAVEGSFTPSGLKTELKVTTMNVGDTAVAIPATALTDRNAISLHNLDGVNTIYLGGATVTAGQAIGTTAGWELPAGGYFNTDITDDITLYAIADAGQTVKIKVLEIA